MKKIAFLITLFLLFSTLSQSAEPKTITIASWNIRILSNNSRDDSELAKIARIIKRYDIVAIQEVRDTIVLKRLNSMCPEYAYIASKLVGSKNHKEIYSFFYRKSVIEPIGEPSVLGDPHDIFIREPFVGTFKAGNFDFTLCTIHLLYGTNKEQRRKELIYLDEVLEVVQRANGKEDDVILLGDFNFGPDDHGWQVDGLGYNNLFTENTTIGGKSPYDNIWINKTNTKEYTGSRGLYKFDSEIFGGDLKTASREVSDHRPVYAEFNTTIDDDENEYGDLSSAVLMVSGFKAKKIESKRTIKYDGKYIASKNSKVFHRSDCSSVKKISNRNVMYFNTRELAANSGRRPCKRCEP